MKNIIKDVLETIKDFNIQVNDLKFIKLRIEIEYFGQIFFEQSKPINEAKYDNSINIETSKNSFNKILA